MKGEGDEVVEGKERKREVRGLTWETGDGDNADRHVGGIHGVDESTSDLQLGAEGSL